MVEPEDENQTNPEHEKVSQNDLEIGEQSGEKDIQSKDEKEGRKSEKSKKSSDKDKKTDKKINRNRLATGKNRCLTMTKRRKQWLDSYLSSQNILLEITNRLNKTNYVKGCSWS